jgi:hypothetical protein
MCSDDHLLLLSLPVTTDKDVNQIYKQLDILQPLDDALKLGEVTITFFKVVERESPVIGRKVEIVRVIVHDCQILYDFRPSAESEDIIPIKNQTPPDPIPLNKAACCIDAFRCPNFHSRRV